MNENTINISDDEIFSKVEQMMSKLRANQRLQSMAEENGLSVKNCVRLTDESIDNVIISVIALLLAKRSDDPRYKTLVKIGMEKRSLKTEIINTYKNQAQQLLSRYKSGGNPTDIV